MSEVNQPPDIEMNEETTTTTTTTTTTLPSASVPNSQSMRIFRRNANSDADFEALRRELFVLLLDRTKIQFEYVYRLCFNLCLSKYYEKLDAMYKELLDTIATFPLAKRTEAKSNLDSVLMYYLKNKHQSQKTETESDINNDAVEVESETETDTKICVITLTNKLQGLILDYSIKNEIDFLREAHQIVFILCLHQKHQYLMKVYMRCLMNYRGFDVSRAVVVRKELDDIFFYALRTADSDTKICQEDFEVKMYDINPTSEIDRGTYDSLEIIMNTVNIIRNYKTLHLDRKFESASANIRLVSQTPNRLEAIKWYQYCLLYVKQNFENAELEPIHVIFSDVF